MQPQMFVAIKENKNHRASSKIFDVYKSCFLHKTHNMLTVDSVIRDCESMTKLLSFNKVTMRMSRLSF